MSGSDGTVSTVSRPIDRTTLAAFIALVVIGGGNAVAVRFSSLALPPFWGAAARSLGAAAIFWLILLVRKARLPKGKALVGAVLYGALGIGAAYSLAYWGVQSIHASLLMVILSLGPLFTMFFAVAHGLEAFRWRGLAGALIALAGIAIGVGAEIGRSVPLASFLAVVAAAVCMAEGSVLFKLFPGGKPLPANVVAFTAAASIQVIVALVAGENWVTPSAPQTIAAFVYLVVVGSVVLFYLYLFLLSRWTASATSYAFLLFPVATAPIAALVLGERVTWQFILGAAIALIGVWIGALWNPSRARWRCAPESPRVHAATRRTRDACRASQHRACVTSVPRIVAPRYSTTISPVIDGWIVQLYGNVPAFSAAHVTLAPWA
jgi:drug/metabolite transporter (DMT)-like permease